MSHAKRNLLQKKVVRIRFINAQNKKYTKALSEIKKGKKKTHWMWYIFP